jgi:biotin synthase
VNRAVYEELVSVLAKTHDLSPEQLLTLLKNNTPELRGLLAERAAALCRQYYGDEIYVRGLIEFTNICRNDCYYCGIRRSNPHLHRYRLTPEQILDCCRRGYRLGFRTFVLQGGEDPWYTESRVVSLCRAVKSEFPDCALTLSIGEWPDEAYQKFYEAGADRYLLRHETADNGHYKMLHPLVQTPENRKRCLAALKRIGYQTGSGFMVGSPGQTPELLVKDFQFLKEIQPQMIGIGPFIPQSCTPFAHVPAGTLEMTLLCISLLRLMFPTALIPATTALGTIRSDGRELGMLAGANVVMPNLSPQNVREDYALYDHKITTGAEAAECLSDLVARMKSVGRRVVMSRGDVYGYAGR